MNSIKIDVCGIGQDKKCCNCQKIFFIPAYITSGNWAYKKATYKGFKYFCSYSCMRAFEKQEKD